jgi:hypothetical protein
VTIEEGESDQGLAEAGEDIAARGEPSLYRSGSRSRARAVTVAVGAVLLLVLMAFSVASRLEVLDRKACLEHD